MTCPAHASLGARWGAYPSKPAKALGLTIPLSLLQRADQVIERPARRAAREERRDRQVVLKAARPLTLHRKGTCDHACHLTGVIKARPEPKPRDGKRPRGAPKAERRQTNRRRMQRGQP